MKTRQRSDFENMYKMHDQPTVKHTIKWLRFELFFFKTVDFMFFSGKNRNDFR